MSLKPNGLSDILAMNGANDHLAPTSSEQASIPQMERDTTNTSELTEFSQDDITDHIHDYQAALKKPYSSASIKTYLSIAIEGDLAGFQIAWLCMSVGFIILKLGNITETVARIPWWAIFVIPTANAMMTAYFDWVIRKYRSTRSVESLRKKRFVFLWLLKLVAAVYIITYWIWGDGSFMARYKNGEKYQESPRACSGQILCVYVAMLAAVAMAEMMITTVIINSEQNLSETRTPEIYRWILCIIRPIVWVYNRTMVMFLCFYAIYGLIYGVFVVGLIADKLCDSFRCAESQRVGLQMLTVPFTVPDYLTYISSMFASWNNVTDDDFLERFVVVFLCQSFYVDVLNSVWLIVRRYCCIKNRDGQQTLHAVSPQDKALMAELAKELPPSPLPASHMSVADNSFRSLTGNGHLETVSLK